MSFHHVNCLEMENLYNQLKSDESKVSYEFTVTFNRDKWWLSKVEEFGFSTLLNFLTLEKYEVKDFMIVEEFHKGTDWLHYHGVLTFKKSRNNMPSLRKAMKSKMGLNQFDKSRDGKIDHIVKSYKNWFGYLIKDSKFIYLNKELNNNCCKELNPKLENNLIKIIKKNKKELIKFKK